MRILFIITGLGVGGAEMQLKAISESLLNNGYSVTVISLMNLHQVNFDKRIEVILLNLKHSPFSWFKSLKQAIYTVKKVHPDIIHTHMYHANLFGRILKVFFPSIPLINTAHSINEGGFLRMLLYRLSNSIPNYCTQVSHQALNSFIEKKYFNPKRAACIYNGIDSSKFFKNSILREETRLSLLGEKRHSHFLFIAVGRLVDIKNHKLLIESFSLMKNKENMHLLILGSGPLKESLTKQVHVLNLTSKVTFINHASNVEAYLNASDAFVLPSFYEGFPLSVLESLFCHCPVITSSNGGMVEIFPKNYEYLFSPYDAQMLVSQMEKMITNHNELKNEISKNSKKLEHDFSIENITNQWVLLYKSLQ